VEEIRRRVRVGGLQPGEQIKQDALAAEFAISRTPLRHALVILASEGLVEHVPNVGFFVAKLSMHELNQIYLMREPLERTLIESIDFDALDMPTLYEVAEQIEVAGEVPDIHAMTSLNRQWHFLIFDASPMKTVKEVVGKLWTMAEGYQFLYTVDTLSRQRVVREHRMLLEALEKHKIPTVVSVARQHRNATLATLDMLVGQRD
jgi:DNA-binding GntR family transcriptional regulator